MLQYVLFLLRIRFLIPCVHLQIIQYQTVRYDTLPLSHISRNRLSEYTVVFMVFLCIKAYLAKS